MATASMSKKVKAKATWKASGLELRATLSQLFATLGYGGPLFGVPNIHGISPTVLLTKPLEPSGPLKPK